MATRGGAPKKIFFYENALSGSIHSTYQLPSLQNDQKPTLGQPTVAGQLGTKAAVTRAANDNLTADNVTNLTFSPLLHTARTSVQTFHCQILISSMTIEY